MKNLYLLATNKPSRLYLVKDKLKLSPLKFTNDEEVGWLTQNIYITSEEEIKEGDWCIMTNDYGDNYLVRVISLKCIGGKEIRVQLLLNGKENTPLLEKCEKIILTTDQDLIKDGIQAINDEFLEWFVKNNSCEEVKLDSIFSAGLMKTKFNN